MRRSGLLFLFLFLLGLAGAAHAAPIALTPAQEARAAAIGSQLRCVVCQNESVEQSRASLAIAMRRAIREQVAAGRTNHQVMQWMEARYGNFIRLDPPFDRLTWLLWGIPALAPLLGAGVAIAAYRTQRWRPAKPLDAKEQARISELLE